MTLTRFTFALFVSVCLCSVGVGEIVALLGETDRSKAPLGNFKFSDETIREFTVDVRTDGSIPAFTHGFETAKLFSTPYAAINERRNAELAEQYAGMKSKTNSLSATQTATAMIFDIAEEMKQDPWLVNDYAIELELWAMNQSTTRNGTPASFASDSGTEESPFKIKAFSKVIESTSDK